MFLEGKIVMILEGFLLDWEQHSSPFSTDVFERVSSSLQIGEQHSSPSLRAIVFCER